MVPTISHGLLLSWQFWEREDSENLDATYILCNISFYYKVWLQMHFVGLFEKIYYKVWQVLQSETEFIIKYDGIIAKYYKSVTIITKWDVACFCQVFFFFIFCHIKWSRLYSKVSDKKEWVHFLIFLKNVL